MRFLPPLLLTLGLLQSLPTAAAATAEMPLPTVRLSPRPELLIADVIPAEGTHLAADLPLKARVEDGYFTFEVNNPAPPNEGPGRLRLPLVREKRIDAWTVTVSGAACADDGTTCVPFHVIAELPRGRLRAALATEPGRAPGSALPPSPPRRAPPKPPEWLANQESRPVLIDFFATWCPPCDRLRDEFLEHPDWASFLEDYEVQSVDADHPSSFAEKDRYRVGGYPTLLLTTAGGDVLERIVGFPGAAEVARRLGAAPRSGWALAGTASCADALPVIRVSVAREEHDEAWNALTERCPNIDELAAQVGALSLAFELAQKAQAEGPALQYALAGARRSEEVGQAASLAYQAGLLLDAASRTEEAAELRAELEHRIDVAAGASERGPDEMISLADAMYYRGKWDPANEAGWSAAGASLLGRAITDRAGVAPGPLPQSVLGLAERLREHEGLVHDYVYLLRGAGDHTAVGRLYGAMIALFPESFTWHYAQAGWLLEQGAVDKAEPSARAALEHGYGDMSLRAAHRLAEVLIARGQNGAAIETIDAALAARVPTEQHVRTWRYRKALITLRDTLAAPGPR